MTITLGLDIGTTGARALAVDESGEVLASASAEYPLYSPRPGWTEQHPVDWWQATRRVVASVAAALPGQMASLGLTGQMYGAVFLVAYSLDDCLEIMNGLGIGVT